MQTILFPAEFPIPKMQTLKELLDEHNEVARETVRIYEPLRELIEQKSGFDKEDSRYLIIQYEIDRIYDILYPIENDKMKPLALKLCDALLDAEEMLIRFTLEGKEIEYRMHFRYSREIGFVALFPRWNVYRRQGTAYNGAFLGSMGDGTALTTIDPVSERGLLLFDAIYGTLGNHDHMNTFFSELPFMCCDSVDMIR